MALEWVVLGYAAAAEAIMILLLTLPGLDPLRKGLVSVTKALLKPFSSVIPFCLFLLLDIYWKYEMRPSCVSLNGCTHAEHLRHHKSLMKSQRNGILIASALLFYWLLYSGHQARGSGRGVEVSSREAERLEFRSDRESGISFRAFGLVWKLWKMETPNWR